MQGARAWPVAGGPSRCLPLQWARVAPDTFPQHGPCPLTSLSQETGDETPLRPHRDLRSQAQSPVVQKWPKEAAAQRS